MPTVTLRAHYDGKHILLDEGYDLPLNAPLMITILPPITEGDRVQWSTAAAQGLARAYGDNEPDYTSADIRK